MSLVERLVKEARRLDLDRVRGDTGELRRPYNMEAADLRDLLLEAAKVLEGWPPRFVVPVGMKWDENLYGMGGYIVEDRRVR